MTSESTSEGWDGVVGVWLIAIAYSWLVCQLTLANTWPLAALSEESSLAVAAQVHGDVREWHECPVPEAVTPSQ
jgi:hypothetical protein